METKPLRLWDRSRTTTDWTCPRKRFWQYEYRGKGIVTEGTSLELFIGTVVHDCLAGIAKGGVDVKDLAKKAYDQVFQVLVPDNASEDDITFGKEQGTLIQGLILGFYKHAWPRIIEAYPQVVLVESEMEKRSSTGDLIFMSKPDIVLGTKDGLYAYLEYKTTRSKKEEWINSWETAVQLHSTIKAVKETHGIDIDHVIVQGLYKGYESYGKQNSPFCYYYRRSGNPPFTNDEICYEYKPGMRRFPVWELPGGVDGWVNAMPDRLLTDQFPRTAPIFFNEDLVEAFFRQREGRERDMTRNMQMLSQYPDDPGMTQFIMDTAFPQRFDQCRPPWGRACEYKVLCHSHVDDPLTKGFTWREPHHVLEAEQQQEAERVP